MLGRSGCRLGSAGASGRTVEALDHLLIGRLTKVLVPLADRSEPSGGFEAHDLVDFSLEVVDRVGCTHRYREHDSPCATGPQHSRSSLGGDAGREAVVDQQDRLSCNRERWGTTPVPRLSTFELCSFCLPDGIEIGFGDAEHADEVPVEDFDVIFGDRSDTQLGLAGRAEFADDENVERSFDCSRHFGGDDDTSSGEADDHRLGAGEIPQVLCEAAACVIAILEDHVRSFPVFEVTYPDYSRS